MDDQPQTAPEGLTSASRRSDTIQAAYDVLVAVERDLGRARALIAAIPIGTSPLMTTDEIVACSVIEEIGTVLHRVASAKFTAEAGLYRLGHWKPGALP